MKRLTSPRSTKSGQYKVLDLVVQRIDKEHQKSGYPKLQDGIKEAVWSELHAFAATGKLEDRNIRAISRRLRLAAEAQSTRSSRAQNSSVLGNDMQQSTEQLAQTNPQPLSSLTKGISKSRKVDGWDQLLLNDVENYFKEQKEELLTRIKQKNDFRRTLDEQVLKRKQQKADRLEAEKRQHQEDMKHWDQLEDEMRAIEHRKRQQRLVVAENCVIQSAEFSQRKKQEAEKRRLEEQRFAEQAKIAYEAEQKAALERKTKERSDLLGFMEEMQREKEEKVRRMAQEREEEKRKDEESRRAMAQKEKEQAEAHEKLKQAFQRRAHMVFPGAVKPKQPVDDDPTSNMVYTDFLAQTTGKLRNEIISAEMARQNLEQQIKERAAKHEQELRDTQHQKELVQMDVEMLRRSEQERKEIKKEMQRRYKRDLEEQIQERQAQKLFEATDGLSKHEKGMNSVKLRSIGANSLWKER